MAKTAASMLAQAIRSQHQSAQAPGPGFQETEQRGAETELEQVEPVNPQSPVLQRKRGRPPGKASTAGKSTTLLGTGLKKRKVKVIQNSPRFRKTTSHRSTQNSRKTSTQNQSRGPAIQSLPPRPVNATNGNDRAQEPEAETSTTARNRPALTATRVPKRGSTKSGEADFQNPPKSLP